MAKTPENQVLGSQLTNPTAKATPALEPNPASEYPKVLYHKDSKPGALLGKQVNSPEEEQELGDDYAPLSALKIETAPAAAPDEGRNGG